MSLRIVLVVGFALTVGFSGCAEDAVEPEVVPFAPTETAVSDSPEQIAEAQAAPVVVAPGEPYNETYTYAMDQEVQAQPMTVASNWSMLQFEVQLFRWIPCSVLVHEASSGAPVTPRVVFTSPSGTSVVLEFAPVTECAPTESWSGPIGTPVSTESPTELGEWMVDVVGRGTGVSVSVVVKGT